MIKSVDGLYTGTEIFDENETNNIYKVIQKLGSGGNGTAYLVHCIKGDLSGNFFTLKFLKTTMKDRRERFLKEIQFIKDYKHPSVLKHYDEGSLSGFPFVVTEYLRHNLDDVSKQIELKEALVYSVQLLSAVNFLQKHNYIHRDIKPKNIFLDNSNAVLADFGLIKNLGDTVVHDDDIEYIRNAMPIQYRTPQLVHYLKTGDIDKKTDIFQLGLVFYEMFFKSPALQQSKHKDDEITEAMFLNKKLRIKSRKYRDKIEPLIWNMLSLESEKIKSSEELLDEFQVILSEFLKDIAEIEFRVVL